MESAKARKFLEEGCDLYEKGDVERAGASFLQAAKLGNAEAQVNLANLYSDGSLQSADGDAKAEHWYKLAVKKRVPEAAYNLAVHHKQRNNLARYRYWIRRAAAVGDEDAAALV